LIKLVNPFIGDRLLSGGKDKTLISEKPFFFTVEKLLRRGRRPIKTS